MLDCTLGCGGHSLNILQVDILTIGIQKFKYCWFRFRLEDDLKYA